MAGKGEGLVIDQACSKALPATSRYPRQGDLPDTIELSLTPTRDNRQSVKTFCHHRRLAMKLPALIVAVMASTLLVSPVRAQEGMEPAGKDSTDGSASRIKELEKERIAVLKKLTEQLSSLYQKGRVDYGELLETTRLLAEAELEAAETDKERLEVYQKLIAALKEHEEWVTRDFRAGRVPGAGLLKAKAERLEAEIRLEKLKMKLAKPGN
jgi:hypothetical protein